jgi:hypothetical protein
LLGTLPGIVGQYRSLSLLSLLLPELAELHLILLLNVILIIDWILIILIY